MVIEQIQVTVAIVTLRQRLLNLHLIRKRFVRIHVNRGFDRDNTFSSNVVNSLGEVCQEQTTKT